MLLIYCEIHAKLINRPTICDQNEKFLNVKAGGTCSYFKGLKFHDTWNSHGNLMELYQSVGNQPRDYRVKPQQWIACNISYLLPFQWIISYFLICQKSTPTSVKCSRNCFTNPEKFEQYSLLDCNVVYFVERLMFRRNISPPLSRSKSNSSKKQRKQAASWNHEPHGVTTLHSHRRENCILNVKFVFLFLVHQDRTNSSSCMPTSVYEVELLAMQSF
jgi:hypothetical protein